MTVLLNRMAPPLLPVVSVVAAPKVTAPLKVCKSDVVMLPASVLAPLTIKLEVPVLLFIAGLVPLMLKLPTVRARCKFKVALLIVSAALVTPKLPPMLPLLVTVKVPALMVVAPVCWLSPDKTKVPLPILVSAPLVLAAAPLMVNTPVD